MTDNSETSAAKGVDDAPAFTPGMSDPDAAATGRKGGSAAGGDGSDGDNRGASEDASAAPEEDNRGAYDTPHPPRSDVAS